MRLIEPDDELNADSYDADLARAIDASLCEMTLQQSDSDARLAAALAESQRQADLEARAAREEAQLERVMEKTAQEARRAEQLGRVREMFNFLQRINDGGDVHQLDAYTTQHLPVVLHMLSDNPDVAVAVDQPQLIAALQGWVPAQFQYHQPDNTTAMLSKTRLSGYIQRAIDTAAQSAEVLQAYELAVQAITCMEGANQERHRKELLNAIAENYETQGGCPQGVRNRIFIRLIDILCTVLEMRR